MFTSLVEMFAQIAVILMDHNTQLTKVLKDEDWVRKLAYLADMFINIKEIIFRCKE